MTNIAYVEAKASKTEVVTLFNNEVKQKKSTGPKTLDRDALEAIVTLVSNLKSNEQLTIYTNSQYVLLALNVFKQKQETTNPDLWARFNVESRKNNRSVKLKFLEKGIENFIK